MTEHDKRIGQSKIAMLAISTRLIHVHKNSGNDYIVNCYSHDVRGEGTLYTREGYTCPVHLIVL